MTPEDLKRARPDRLPSGEPKVEDLPSDWAEEDREIEGRKPDLGETEEDTAV